MEPIVLSKNAPFWLDLLKSRLVAGRVNAGWCGVFPPETLYCNAVCREKGGVLVAYLIQTKLPATYTVAVPQANGTREIKTLRAYEAVDFSVLRWGVVRGFCFLACERVRRWLHY